MFQRKPIIPDGIRPLNLRNFQCIPNKLFPKLSQLVPKFHGEYDELALDHLGSFYTFVKDYEIYAEDYVMKLFIKTLKDNAREAYESLPTQRISSWRQLEQWFLDVFHDAGEEGSMCYELEEGQEYTMETEFCVSPLDEFFNIKKQEDEFAVNFFMRMFNIYQEIPLDVKPTFYELLNKIYKLGYDSQLYSFLKYLHDEIVAEDNGCGMRSTEATQNPNEEGSLDQIEKESIIDETYVEIDNMQYQKEECLLSSEQISDLLDTEYQRNAAKEKEVCHGQQIECAHVPGNRFKSFSNQLCDDMMEDGCHSEKNLCDESSYLSDKYINDSESTYDDQKIEVI